MKKPLPFGKYYLLERINVGGMAEVFKAKSFGVEGFERIVAVKRILPSIAEDQEFITMFIDEAKVAVQLTHANIAQIFDLGKVGDSYFIAMEYVHGRDLRAIFDRARKVEQSIPVPMACYTIMKVCEGLDYAHNKKDAAGRDLNLVHRDVSPQNVLISYDGEVKVIDFGIAKAACRSAKTQAGILKGKFGYMSPEQVRGLPLDRRSDIFSVGICLYELLTLERLFQGESDFSTLEKVRNVEIMPPSTYNPKIPDELEQIVLKALSKEVEDRYQTAMDLHDDLQSFMYTSGNFFARKDLAGYVKTTFPEDDTSDPSLVENKEPSPQMKPAIPNAPAAIRSAQPRGASAPPPPPRAALRPKPPLASAPPPPPRAATRPQPPSASAPPPPPQKKARKQTLLGMPTTQPREGASPSAIPQDLAAGRVATPVTDASMPNQSLDMDWDDEELATQVYDKPSDLLSMEFSDDDKSNGKSTDMMHSPSDATVTPAGPTRDSKIPSHHPSNPAAIRSSGPPPSISPAPVAHDGPLMNRLSPSRPPSAAVRRDVGPTPSYSRTPSAVRISDRRKGNGTLIALSFIVLVLIIGGVAFLVFNMIGPGSINGTVRPHDSVIMLDDTRIEVTPDGQFLIENLEPGVYTLNISADGYSSTAETVKVKAGRSIPLAVVLEKSAPIIPTTPIKTGLAVNVQPPGAKIIIDNNPHPELTPVPFIELSPGEYAVRIEKEDYLTISEQVTVSSGDVSTIERQMQPESITVDLTLSPSEAECTLFQEGYNKKTVSTNFKVVPHRNPRLECKANGYESFSEPIEAPTDGSLVASLPITLTKKTVGSARPTRVHPRPRPPTTTPVTQTSQGGNGYISVNTRPWTKVYVDGRFIRNTPLMRHEVPSGPHRLTLVNEDFNIRENVSVNVKAGQNSQVVRNLVR